MKTRRKLSRVEYSDNILEAKLQMQEELFRFVGYNKNRARKCLNKQLKNQTKIVITTLCKLVNDYCTQKFALDNCLLVYSSKEYCIEVYSSLGMYQFTINSSGCTLERFIHKSAALLKARPVRLYTLKAEQDYIEVLGMVKRSKRRRRLGLALVSSSDISRASDVIRELKNSLDNKSFLLALDSMSFTGDIADARSGSIVFEGIKYKFTEFSSHGVLKRLYFSSDKIVTNTNLTTKLDSKLCLSDVRGN